LAERKYTLEMIGESLREIGELLIVFVPLYDLFEKDKPSWYIVIAVFTLGIACLVGGIRIERTRRV
jgi:hypothetical protein